ncbi:MAG TPA: hypothetical protein VLK85_02440, partial [Ramlibacter sp.]|nr:hypothetical protein [Ramlibacter sp.]
RRRSERFPMHGAPSVSYPVGRSRFAGLLLLACWLAGALALLLWSWQSEATGWRQALGLGSCVLVGLLAARSWLAARAGQLSWDGETWSWSAATLPAGGTVEVSLDLQHVMLLRWHGGGAAQWLWPEKASQPGRWDDLRRAVYSRARPQAPRGAQVPSANP